MKTLLKIIITLLVFGSVILLANLARDCDHFGGVEGCVGTTKKKGGGE